MSVKTLKRTRLVAGLLILVIAVVFASNMGWLSLSIIPGYEGLNAGVEGVEVSGNFYKLGSTLPTGYRWLSASPHSTVLGADKTFLDSEGQVVVEVGDPKELVYEGEDVDYWVQSGDTYVHVLGEVHCYEVPVTFSARDTGMNNVYKFSGEKVWFALAGLAWNRAAQPQSIVEGKQFEYGFAWEAPLQAVITEYTTTDNGDHYYLEPRVTGRSITLYSEPKQAGTISDLLTGGVESNLGNSLSPDSRLSRLAYFGVTMTDFGETVTLFGDYTPVAEYTVKVYTLRLGKYTYTNIDDTPWEPRPPEDNVWDQAVADFAEWVNNTIASLTGASQNPLLWIILIIAGLLIAAYFLTPLLSVLIVARRG